MKYLFITLNVLDGENRHTHRVLHTTNGTDIKFVAELYASRYYGEDGERYDDWWNFQAGCMGVRVENVLELTEFEYKLMSDIFDGNVRSHVPTGLVNDKGDEISEGDIVLGKPEIVQEFVDNFTKELYNTVKLPDNINEYDVKEFKKEWGQNHVEICNNLGYHPSHNQSDELLMVDYFYLEVEKKWYPIISSMYSEKEQLIADYLRLNR